MADAVVEGPVLSTSDPSFWFAIGPDIAALVVTCLLLVFAALVYQNAETRPALRRQSLQMLFTVQLATLFFSSAHIVSFYPGVSARLCEWSVIVVFFTSAVFHGHTCPRPSPLITRMAGNFQHLVIMLIAVNLQLTVVHSISTAGFTKWYIGTSLLVASAVCLPGAIAHVWGHDPFVGVCWCVLEDRRARIAWVVGTTYICTILSAAVTLVSTCTVLARLTISSCRVRKAFSGAGLSGALAQQSILRSLIVRILPHPVYLVISNIIVVTTDLLITVYRKPDSEGGSFIETTNLDALFGIFYTTPPLIIAFTVLFFDPSFSAAVRHLFVPKPKSWMTAVGTESTNPSSQSLGSAGPRHGVSTVFRIPDPSTDAIPMFTFGGADATLVGSDTLSYPRFAWTTSTVGHGASRFNMDEL